MQGTQNAVFFGTFWSTLRWEGEGGGGGGPGFAVVLCYPAVNP